jgi:hypothetical protein
MVVAETAPMVPREAQGVKASLRGAIASQAVPAGGGPGTWNRLESGVKKSLRIQFSMPIHHYDNNISRSRRRQAGSMGGRMTEREALILLLIYVKLYITMNCFCVPVRLA